MLHAENSTPGRLKPSQAMSRCLVTPKAQKPLDQLWSCTCPWTLQSLPCMALTRLSMGHRPWRWSLLHQKCLTPKPTPPAPAALDETTSLLRELVWGQMALAEMVQSLVTCVSAVKQGKLAAPTTSQAPKAPPPTPACMGKGLDNHSSGPCQREDHKLTTCSHLSPGVTE